MCDHSVHRGLYLFCWNVLICSHSRAWLQGKGLWADRLSLGSCPSCWSSGAPIQLSSCSTTACGKWKEWAWPMIAAFQKKSPTVLSLPHTHTDTDLCSSTGSYARHDKAAFSWRISLLLGVVFLWAAAVDSGILRIGGRSVGNWSFVTPAELGEHACGSHAWWKRGDRVVLLLSCQTLREPETNLLTSVLSTASLSANACVCIHLGKAFFCVCVCVCVCVWMEGKEVSLAGMWSLCCIIPFSFSFSSTHNLATLKWH